MTPTDDERRRVAAALRAYDGKGADADTIGEVTAIIIGAGDADGWSWREIYARLADLIDPDCEDGRYEGVHTARPVDRGARGWTSFNERLPEPGAPVLCKGKNGAYYVGKPVTFGGERTAKVWVPHGNEYRSPAAWRPIEPPSCDREALLALADECDSVHMHKVAHRIREALGVTDHDA